MKTFKNFFKKNINDNDNSMIEQVDDKMLSSTMTKIENNIDILFFYSNLSMKSLKINEKSLTSDISDELTEIFGSENLKKNFEYLTKVWILKAYDSLFYVFCSKRGTDIAINDTYDNVSNGKHNSKIKKFLIKLNELINKKNNEEYEKYIRYKNIKKYNI